MQRALARDFCQPRWSPVQSHAPLGSRGKPRSGCRRRRVLTECTVSRNTSHIDCSRSLAALRAAESLGATPRFVDPYSSLLADGAEPPASEAQRFEDANATAFIDEQLLRAVDIVNMDLQQEHRQVVLLGCGMDTRPYRLPWPAGTVLFLLAPADVHAAAKDALKGTDAAVPRGCLLRRVSVDLEGEQDFSMVLEAAGYRGDRLSVWGIQGLARLGLRAQQVRWLLAQVATVAAHQSLLVGQLPPAPAAAASEWLASAGLLGTLLPAPLPPSSQLSAAAPAAGGGGNQASERVGGGHSAAELTESELSGWHRRLQGPTHGSDAVVARLFTAQQQHLSLSQMRIYNDHSRAAEETDEDFEGHFS